jgi:hypothetical protein
MGIEAREPEYRHLQPRLTIVEHDGDVLPPDDINAFDDDELLLDDDAEFSRRALQATSTLMGETEAKQEEFGVGYGEIVDMIETGIDNSKKGGYAELKVISDNGSRIGLGQYLATGLFRAQTEGRLTKNGLDTILSKYKEIADTYVQKTPPAVTTQTREFPKIISGIHAYKDARSAAAGDYDDE